MTIEIIRRINADNFTTSVTAERTGSRWTLHYIDNGIEDAETNGRYNTADTVEEVFEIALREASSCEEVGCVADLVPGSYCWMAEYDGNTQTISTNILQV